MVISRRNYHATCRVTDAATYISAHIRAPDSRANTIAHIRAAVMTLRARERLGIKGVTAQNLADFAEGKGDFGRLRAQDPRIRRNWRIFQILSAREPRYRKYRKSHTFYGPISGVSSL